MFLRKTIAISVQHAHGAVTAYRLGGNEKLVDNVKLNFESAEISDKLKALLNVAGKVQKGGKKVTPEDVARARREGATDKEIHDTVLIAAAFCMFNRYVDGLAAWAPTDVDMYRENGKRLAEIGYVHSTDGLLADVQR
jgi:alkylhydroperoxidase/carboxymuconolactone decarboxylase family protein YurZ